MKGGIFGKVIGRDKQAEQKPKLDDVYGLAQKSFIIDRPRPWFRKPWSREDLKKVWPNLTSEQVSSLKDAFTLFDATGKGWFGREELKEVMLALSGGREPASQEVEIVFSELDCNSDGRVDFPEFVAKFMHFGESSELQEVMDMLSVTGHDNGSLTIQSLVSIFQIIGEPLPDGDVVYLHRVISSMCSPDGKVPITALLPHLQAMDEQAVDEASQYPRLLPMDGGLESLILNATGDSSFLEGDHQEPGNTAYSPSSNEDFVPRSKMHRPHPTEMAADQLIQAIANKTTANGHHV